MRSEVLLQQHVNSGLEHECVVDGDHPHFGHFVPAGLSATGVGGIHHVVGDEEVGLEELGEPAEGWRGGGTRWG